MIRTPIAMPRPTDRKNSRKTVSVPSRRRCGASAGAGRCSCAAPARWDAAFAELARALQGVSARTLLKQLRELEADGIVSRRVYPQIPPKVEYSLTPLGRKLEPVLLAMHA
ncbi:MAG: winged helix-turn-helix transcriptional regulator [Planctomycetaceae bacterium]